MPVNKAILAAVLAAMGASTGPSYSLDFSSTLPSQVTFTRSGSRTAIVAGVLTTVTTNNPAIESTAAGVLGLSIEPASTNSLLQSNSFTTSPWGAATNVTPTSGQASPDGGSNGWDIAETTASGYHEIKQDISGVSSGTVMCSSVFVKAKTGSTSINGNPINAFGLLNCNQFTNTGARVAGLLDPSAAAFAYDSNGIGGASTTFNNVSGGSQRLANGWTRIWVTGTTTSTGIKSIRHRTLKNNVSGLGENYAGATTDGHQVAFAQTEFGVSRPTSYKATTTAAASTNADSAIISNISWLNVAQGTFIVEYDCTSGVLLGSGTNTVVSGGALPANRITGKVALAWSGTTSDLVYNGGSTTTGVQPTFGSDIRLLSTSATTNSGHIKSLKYYPTRLSVSQIQGLTAPSSTAPIAGTYRVATQRNVMNNTTVTIGGTTPYQAFRWPAVIGSGARTKLRVSASNWTLNDATGDTNPGNTITIESLALVRLSTSEIAPIYFSGLRSVTLSDGQVKFNSDDLLPSAFPSLTSGGVFPNGEAFELRGKVKCASGGKIPCGRWGVETGAQVWNYDGTVTSVSSVDATGAFTATGSAAALGTKGYSVVIEGPFVTGDPMTLVGYGDSIVEGVGGTLQASGTWFQKTVNSLGAAYLQAALGGQSQAMFWKSANINQYVGLGSVLIDNTGTNNLGPLEYPLPYYNARQAGVRAILRPSLNVRTTSTDSFVSNANQTVSLPYPDSNSIALISMTANGYIDAYYKMNAVRDTGDKWITNGTAYAYTVDGTHQQVPGDDLMYPELKAQLQALVYW